MTRLVQTAAGGASVGSAVDGNPLADGWAMPAAAGPLVVLWSGSLADDPFAAHPANWMPPGRAAFEELCGELAGGEGSRLCFRPHCRQILSDLPSCRQFLLDHADDPFGIALCPASLLEPGMLEDIDDHLVRWFEAFGGICDLVFLDDVVAGEADACVAVPLGEGCLPASTVRSLLTEYVGADVPIVLRPESIDDQLAWLGA